MSARVALVVLLIASTAALVIGVSIERSDSVGHQEPAATAAPSEPTEAGEEHADEAAPGGNPHAEERSAGSERGERDELLGVDVEAAPFVALVAALSLALALAVWVRHAWAAPLAVVAVAMALFAALDVREVLHQIDESKSGLALLAAFVAVLHAAASTIAARGYAAT